MTGGSLWTTLGIAATTDRSAIRRAYASKLKATNPEDDPEGFQQLRAAYETALARAAAPLEWAGGAPAEARVEAPPPAAVPADRQPMPVREAEIGVSQAEQDELRAMFTRLQALIEAAPVDTDAVLAVFHQIMKAPALDAVVARDRAEAWIASIIVGAAPRADVLIDPAADSFGWAADRVGGRAPWVYEVLRRREALDLVARLAWRDSPHRAAFRALKTKPGKLHRLRCRLTPGLASQVQALLHAADPGILREVVDETALAWWTKRLQRRVQWGLWILVAAVATWMEVIAFQSGGPLAGASPTTWAISAAWTLAAFGGGWWAAARGRRMIGRRWPDDRPAWLRFGWIAPALAGLATAATAPSIAFLPAIIAVEIAALAWAAAMSAPDRAPPRVLRFALYFLVRLELRLSRAGAAAACCLPLLLYTFVLAAEASPHNAAFADVALIGAVPAFSLGFVDLRRSWLSVSSHRTRMALLAAVTVLAALTPLVLWSAAPASTFVAPAALLVDVVMFAHLVLAPERVGLRVRNFLSKLGWIAFAIGALLAQSTGQGNLVLLFGGMWVLAIAASGLIGAVHEERIRARGA